MPFTFSHPAIILPLTYLPRRWYSLTGLIIGSLTPDFEYFIRMRLYSSYSHTWTGLLWFDLPVGLVLAFIFHNIVRDTLIDNQPAIIRKRLAQFKELNWNKRFTKSWLVITVSTLVGAATHLLWDGFTHDNGYFVTTIPAMTNEILIAGRQVPLFKMIQHASTLLGGALIVVVILKLPSDQTVHGFVNFRYWIIIAGLIFAITIIRTLLGLDYQLYGDVFITCISAGLISLVITPLIMRTAV